MLHDVGAECEVHDEMAEFLGYKNGKAYIEAQDRGGIKKRMAKALGIK